MKTMFPYFLEMLAQMPDYRKVRDEGYLPFWDRHRGFVR